MKKKKISKKLEFNKENIAKLTASDFSKIRGGEETNADCDATWSIWGCATNVKTRGDQCCGVPPCSPRCLELSNDCPH